MEDTEWVWGLNPSPNDFLQMVTVKDEYLYVMCREAAGVVTMRMNLHEKDLRVIETKDPA